jgi:hypothetical protein
MPAALCEIEAAFENGVVERIQRCRKLAKATGQYRTSSADEKSRRVIRGFLQPVQPELFSENSVSSAGTFDWPF